MKTKPKKRKQSKKVIRQFVRKTVTQTGLSIPSPVKKIRKLRKPKEPKDGENVLETLPDKNRISSLNMEELSNLFTQIVKSEIDLSRDKEGFLPRFFEHCEALRFITAAKYKLLGNPAQEDNTYWATHVSRTWRISGILEIKQDM